MILTQCEADRQVQYTSWATLVTLELGLCGVSHSLSHHAAEALGGSSQGKRALFKRLSSYP